MRALFFAAFAALFLTSSGAEAASGPGGGTPANWTQMQKFEHYIGELSAVLGICRYYDLASKLKTLSDLSPYGRQGWASVQSFDGIKGGQCGRLAASAEDILGDRAQLAAYLTEKYDCSAGRCAPEEGADEAPKLCQLELDAHLVSLPIEMGDIQSTKMVTMEPAIRERSNANFSHEVSISLRSCSGSLVVQLTEACYPRNTFTRGDCDIEGISNY